MSDACLFSDGSVDTKTGIGYGAYLLVEDTNKALLQTLSSRLLLKQFTSTSSTKLELETLLWALEEVMPQLNELNSNLTIYTDSQNIVGLPSRRQRLERNNYYARNNTRLANYLLYQKFYRFSDQMNFELVKVKGHKKSSQRSEIYQYFALVDQASRQALRESKTHSA